MKRLKGSQRLLRVRRRPLLAAWLLWVLLVPLLAAWLLWPLSGREIGALLWAWAGGYWFAVWVESGLPLRPTHPARSDRRPPAGS